MGAAFQLAKRKAFDVTVLERAAIVGGNAASFELRQPGTVLTAKRKQ